ncbi:MAG: NADH-quinone oxidoreductase subunit C [Planctomycetota bacterium]
MNPTESPIRYEDSPPASMPAAAAKALAPFAPRYSEHHGTRAVLVERERFLEAARALEAAGYASFVDHTAVDYPERTPRFTIVVLLMDMETQDRLLLKTRVDDGESVASLTPLWSAANWAERETYDMFGIPFQGHPNLCRIYMPQDYDGWPLRRDFPLAGHLRFRD